MPDKDAYPVLVKLSDERQTVAPDETDIRGRQVKDRDGAELGRIDELLIDPTERKVRMLRIEHGGILGFGAKASFVPVEAIVGITDDEVHIDQTRQRVADAPAYDPDVVAQPLTFAPLYGYYAYQPFWEGW